LESLDYELIAFNVRCMRMAHSQTQAELASAAGVDTSTIHRLESGARVHPRTLRKVCAALGESVSFVSSVLPYGTPARGRRVFVHRRQELAWFASQDRRKQTPADSQARIQHEEERLRLGRQGLVASFQAYSFAMPNGPGVSNIEIFERVSCGRNETYENCIAFCMRGALRFQIAGEITELQEGDGIGFSADEEAWMEPLKPVGPEECAPLVWFIAANRKGHVPIEFNKIRRQRTRHPSK